MVETVIGKPVLELCKVSKSFHRRGFPPVTAAREVDLHVCEAETVALVGESGSGKSTLAKIALGLVRPDAGEVKLFGKTISGLPMGQLREVRTAMQPVFQDSSAAFNPRRTVTQLLSQAAIRHPSPIGTMRERLIILLEQVGLRPGEDYLGRFPHELSGGQRQRLSIARALAMDPPIIIADEPLSGADVSIRGQLLNLMIDLREKRKVAYLFITHDISIAKAFAHRVAVMYKGSIVERGNADEVLANPQHEYTKRLVEGSLTVEQAEKAVEAISHKMESGVAAS